MKILIAEDNLDSSRLLESMLKNSGHETIIATDAAEALDVLQRREDAPPLALLSSNIHGTDILELCNELKKSSQTNGAYIILLVADNARERVSDYLKAGVDDYIIKPFDAVELRARLQTGIRITSLQKSLADHVRVLKDAFSQLQRNSATITQVNEKLMKEITERTRTEEELRLQKTLLEAQGDATIDGVLAVSNDKKVISFNRRFVEIWGIPEELLAIGSDERMVQFVLNQLVNPEGFSRKIEYLYRNQDETDQEEIHLKDGRILDRFTAPIKTSDGVYYGRVWHFRDITQSRRAEEALRNSQALYQSLVQSLPLNIFRKDLDGRFTFGNKRFFEAVGKPAEEIIGKTDFDMFPRELAEKYRLDDLRVVETGEVFEDIEEYQGTNSDKTYVQVLKTPVYDSNERIVGTQGFFWDITERKRAEEELRRSEERYKQIIEHANDIIFRTDEDGFFTFVNPIAARIMKCPAEEIVGRHYLEMIHPTYREAAMKFYGRQFINKIPNTYYEYPAVSKDGVETWLGQNVQLITDGDKVVGFQAVSRDITERKKIEEELRVFAAKLERSNRELEDFASVASHDLQEPLRKIQAFGDRLKSKCADALNEQGRDYLERMQSAASRMQTLINDLLTFSRVTTKAQPFAPVDLDEIVRGVVSDLEVRIEQTGGRVEIGELKTIDADPLQMRQLMQNLIGNALKFRRPEEASVVKVYHQAVDDQMAEQVNGAKEQLCQLVIEDNGCGFDEKYADRIFAVFQRLHTRSEYEGTGVGLAVCRKIAERHGGKIIARSTPGVGSKFIVTLPIKQANKEVNLQ